MIDIQVPVPFRFTKYLVLDALTAPDGYRVGDYVPAIEWLSFDDYCVALGLPSPLAAIKDRGQ